MTSDKKLREVIQDATRLTTELRHALEANQLQKHEQLLIEREQALELFEEVHESSTPEECSVSLPALKELKAADESLREFCQSKKSNFADEMNKSALRPRPALPQEYAALKIPLVDRKA